MTNTQNEKKMQIHSSMLVVGVDIAKKTHYARAFDDRGIELGENKQQGRAKHYRCHLGPAWHR